MTYIQLTVNAHIALQYLLWFLEPSRKHVSPGQCVIFVSGKPALHVHERLKSVVDAVVFLYHYLMIVRNRALRTRDIMCSFFQTTKKIRFELLRFLDWSL
jgi:hypothetical protein